MSSDADVLATIGYDFVLKVARVVSGAICYGAYVVLMFFLFGIFYRHGLRGQISTLCLILVTLAMFMGGTLFLCLDVVDLVRRLQMIIIDNPGDTFQEKLYDANDGLKRVMWTEQMLFIFMLILGDSVVLWRTWAIYRDGRKWLILPIFTWVGSLTAGLFELGCDVRTHWAINNLAPTVSSVGEQKCANADLSSYTLSFTTNILCTTLIAFKTWQYRKVMVHYLGRARRRTAAEKVLTLFMESGFLYIVLYILQAIPIYRVQLTPWGNLAFNVVNAIIQQAMGTYPTVIIVLVRMHKSLWETQEVSEEVFSRSMKFHDPGIHGDASEGALTMKTVVSDILEDGDRLTEMDDFKPAGEQCHSSTGHVGSAV